MFQVYKQTKELFIKSFIHYMAGGESPQGGGNELSPQQIQAEIAEEKALLQKMLKDGILDGKDLSPLKDITEDKEGIMDETKILMAKVIKETLQKGFTIKTKEDFEVFQKIYFLAYGKESGILGWKKGEWYEGNGFIKVINKNNKNVWVNLDSLYTSNDGIINIYLNFDLNNNRSIEEGFFNENGKGMAKDVVWNNNEIDENAIRRSEITTIYEEYLKELEKIYQAYEVIDAIGKDKIKEILENVKNNKKGFIEYQTNSNQTIDEIKTNFEQKIKRMKDYFKTNNGRIVDEVVNNSQETPEVTGNTPEDDTSPAPATEAPTEAPAEATPVEADTSKKTKPTFDKAQINGYIEKAFKDKNKPTQAEMLAVIDTALSQIKGIKNGKATEHQVYYIIQKQLGAQKIDGIRGPETNHLIKAFNKQHDIPGNTNVIGIGFLTKLKKVINGEQITTQEKPEQKESTEQVQQKPETQTEINQTKIQDLKNDVIKIKQLIDELKSNHNVKRPLQKGLKNYKKSDFPSKITFFDKNIIYFSGIIPIFRDNSQF